MAQTLVIDGLKRRSLPINLRQSGNSDAQMLISARIRKSPWWHLSKAAGCWAYTTYNHMYHLRAYIKPEDGGLFEEYKYLTEHVSMWDVAVERQIQIKGPDAMLRADDVWPHILEQGEEFNLRVIAPSHVRRLEAGILSYGQDMDIENNPFEVRLGWQVDLGKGAFIGKEALVRIKEEGVKKRLIGLRVDGAPLTWYNEDFYLVKDRDSGDDLGYVTSAFWSPNMESNIALAVMPRSHWRRGTQVKVQLDGIVDAEMVRVPFFDPTKERPKSTL